MIKLSNALSISVLCLTFLILLTSYGKVNNLSVKAETESGQSGNEMLKVQEDVQPTGRTIEELEHCFEWVNIGFAKIYNCYIYSSYIPTFLEYESEGNEDNDVNGFMSQDASYFFAIFSEKEGFNKELELGTDFMVKTFDTVNRRYPTFGQFVAYPLTTWLTDDISRAGSAESLKIPTGFDLSIYKAQNVPSSLSSPDPLNDDFADQLKDITMKIDYKGAEHDPYREIVQTSQGGDHWGRATFTVSAVNVTEKSDGSYTTDLVVNSDGYYKYHVWGESRDLDSFTIATDIPVTKTYPVKGIDINSVSNNLYVGDSIDLTATVTPDNTDDQAVTWTSSDEEVATVDSNGKVTAISAGEAVITVTTEDGSYTDSITIHVKEIPVNGVSLDRHELSMKTGDTASLKATVAPDNAGNKSVSWKSKNSSVAEVDGDGNVTAVSAGTTDIIVSTEDGSYTDKCTVTVSEDAKPQETTVSAPEVEAVEASVSDPDFVAFEKVDIHDYMSISSGNVKFKSSNKKAASVNNKGIVTFKKTGGKVTITAYDKASKSEVGSYTFDVKVPSFKAKKTSMSASVSLNGFDLLNTSGVNENPTWVSSKPSVVSVDAKTGEITAKSTGSAKIYAVYGANSITDKNGTRTKIKMTIKVNK